MEQPTLAQLLARMERDDLIRRETDPQDKRSSLVSLTGIAVGRLPRRARDLARRQCGHDKGTVKRGSRCKVVTAGCLGVVDTCAAARCLAFETALNAVVIVSDVLKPPTYAYSPYGSWAAPPYPPAPGAPRASAVELTPLS